MSFGTRVFQIYANRERRIFEATKSDLEGAQRKVLSRLLESLETHGLRNFKADKYENLSLPEPSTFEEQSVLLESRWNELSGVMRVPTSGTTSQRKWIPYTPQFRNDLNRAASVWLSSVGELHPQAFHGSHYWSLSWLPTELRGKYSNDDSMLLPGWQRWLFSDLFSVPQVIQNLKTSEETLFATMVYLTSNRKLSLVSIWSPTFFLELCRRIWDDFDKIVRDGDTFLKARNLPRPKFQPPKGLLIRGSFSVESVDCQNFFKTLWPNLKVISCWTSSTSLPWAHELQMLFASSTILPKGLWATEGPVTIPFDGRMALAASTHFFEFRCLATNRILPAWKLEKDQIVQPLLWNANGLIRYPLNDRMRVTDYLGQIPCLDFQGRINSVDLVGEKISEQVASETLKQISLILGSNSVALSLVAVETERRYDLAILQSGNLKPEAELAIARATEQLLSQGHHYKLARELGQLSAAAVKCFSTVGEFQKSLAGPANIEGQTKIETLKVIASWH